MIGKMPYFKINLPDADVNNKKFYLTDSVGDISADGFLFVFALLDKVRITLFGISFHVAKKTGSGVLT